MKKIDKEEQFYQVESVIDKKKIGNKLFYRIKWKGYSQTQSTWESHKNLKYCQDMIDEYEKIHQDDSSSGQNKGQSLKQKYISIASESDDIQVQSKQKEGSLPKTPNLQSKRKKSQRKKKQNSFIFNSPTSSHDKQIMIHSSYQAKQTEQPKTGRSKSKQVARSNLRSQEKINSLRSHNLSRDKKSNEDIAQDEAINNVFKLNIQENSFQENSSQEQKIKVLNLEIQKKNLSKNKHIQQQKGRQYCKTENFKPLTLKNKKMSKKQALKLKRMHKQIRIMKESQVPKLKVLKKIDKKCDSTDNKESNSVQYLKNIHEVIAFNKKSDNVKVELQSHKDIGRIRLIESDMLKEIRDYVIEYASGEVKIFNTISLFANYPLEFIEYLQGKNVFLK